MLLPTVGLFVLVHLGLKLLHGPRSITFPYVLLLGWKLLPSATHLACNVDKGQLADFWVCAKLVSKVDIYDC